jgi:hypothetical protein
VECKLKSVNLSRVSDPTRVFRSGFGVTRISDDWNRSTTGAVVKCLGAPGTVAQPIRESNQILKDAVILWIFSQRTAGVI